MESFFSKKAKNTMKIKSSGIFNIIISVYIFGWLALFLFYCIF